MYLYGKTLRGDKPPLAAGPSQAFELDQHIRTQGTLLSLVPELGSEPKLRQQAYFINLVTTFQPLEVDNSLL